ADGTFRLKTRFPGEGTYRLLADFFPTGGTPQRVPLTVTTTGFTTGLEESQPRLVSDLSTKTGKNLAVALQTTPALPVATLKTLLHFQLTTSEGLEKYLGAWAHLLVASQDLVDLIHAHPAIADGGPEIQFNLIFPRAGMYRLWIEVQRQGTVNTVSFTLPVKALE
ncbi:MAG: hypothetical protein L0312_13600, partial [Acidobacteria bacterium]|nr:hypothetical protein [Acidobacteriota bacterium]